MVEEYRRVIARAVGTPEPMPAALPRHLTNDYGAVAESIANEMGIDLEVRLKPDTTDGRFLRR